MNKAQPVPCVVRTEGLAKEDSLAENVQRAALHPLDQFSPRGSLSARPSSSSGSNSPPSRKNCSTSTPKMA
jgi:hypothetical protein